MKNKLFSEVRYAIQSGHGRRTFSSAHCHLGHTARPVKLHERLLFERYLQSRATHAHNVHSRKTSSCSCHKIDVNLLHLYAFLSSRVNNKPEDTFNLNCLRYKWCSCVSCVTFCGHFKMAWRKGGSYAVPSTLYRDKIYVMVVLPGFYSDMKCAL